MKRLTIVLLALILSASCKDGAKADETAKADEPDRTAPVVDVDSISGEDVEVEPPGSGRSPTSDGETRSGELKTVPADTKIKIRREPCYGHCPSFEVELDATGAVKFKGTDYVARFGIHERQIDTEQVRELLHRADEVGYFEMDEAWLAETCRSRATDNPTTVVHITAYGVSHDVSDYFGCRPRRLVDGVPIGIAPRESPRQTLRDLQDMIVDTAVPRDWLEPATRSSRR